MSQFARSTTYKKRRRNYKGKGLTPKQKAEIENMMLEPVEKKYYDTSFDAQDVLLTPTFVDLTAPADGVLADQIVGDTIRFQNLSYKFTLIVSDTTNYIRLVLFQWFPDNANDAPAWNQMFQFQTGGFPIGLTDVMSPLLLGEGNSRNFKVLMNEEFYLDSDNPIQLLKGYIDKGVRKDIGVENTANKGTGHLYLMHVSDSNMSGHPYIHGYVRVRYTDQ